ncbi:MAG: radical SAM protein, partial [Anaerolineaceae bacterium]|nr:radical SAM protein [Anaerolineaceae bacterium]
KELCSNLDLFTAPDYQKRITKITQDDLEDGPELTNCDCMIDGLETELSLPFSQKLVAPYRMDLALTYRCNNRCTHCYNAPNRNKAELNTTEWKNILDNLWDIGIPHIIFTGGEPTLRPDLPELVAYAEKKGQITGINTNGRMLKDDKLVQSLLDAGLDHVQITVESHDPDIHNQMVNAPAWEETIQGLKNVVNSRLYVMTNTTLLQNNYKQLVELLVFLNEIGVQKVGLNSLIYAGCGLNVSSGLSNEDLIPLLETAKTLTSKYSQQLTWYTPTQYCYFDPIMLDVGVKGCTAALFNMCIEPDGEVLPCQSYYQSLGNIQLNSWQSIWEHELALQIRERKYIPEACSDCGILPVCGGGCPLALKSGHAAPPKPIMQFTV